MGMTEKQDAESVGFVPNGNEAAAPAVRRIVKAGAATDLDPNGNTLRVAGLKDNNNTTSPSANQTDPWYDRPKLRDTSSHAALRDPLRKTAYPQDVGGVKDGKPIEKGAPRTGKGQTLSEPKPKAEENSGKWWKKMA